MKKMTDRETAEAFATSWNNLRRGPIYDKDQVRGWFAPLTNEDIEGKTILEMGCGNGSLMYHVLDWDPKFLLGIDLGSSVDSAARNLRLTGFQNWRIEKKDLMIFESEGFDVVYSIGVLHHLQNPRNGFRAVLQNVNSGGRFHCWVYAREGNGLVIMIVDPLRRVVSTMPWKVGKYCFAFPLACLMFFYVKWLFRFLPARVRSSVPLGGYFNWIMKREFRFFWHVVFDQLVTPKTTYLEKSAIERWLFEDSRIKKSSIYIANRNGNSWIFGGTVY